MQQKHQIKGAQSQGLKQLCVEKVNKPLATGQLLMKMNNPEKVNPEMVNPERSILCDLQQNFKLWDNQSGVEVGTEHW